MTVKLYYENPYLAEFEAQVVRRLEVDGRPAVVLGRTAFYPTGGGQPHDTGWLNDVPVLDVQLEEDSGEVVHVLAGRLDAQTVLGRLDWERRHDHMQQHTGQHILSEAFVRVSGAQTISFHLGEEASTIDLDRAPISMEELRSVEDLANRIVFENRPVMARFLTPEETAQVPFRKPPAVSGSVRLVEVAGFDWSACGGTHCRSTGEVGLIHIAGVERRGNETRATFLCGRRALEDYRRKEAVLYAVSSFLTTGWPALPDIIRKTDEERRTAQRQLQKAREELAGLEAAVLFATAEPLG
ncbi:MAG: alanyl-tRNA editing protein, partial [Anaerolineae bacterium]